MILLSDQPASKQNMAHAGDVSAHRQLHLRVLGSEAIASDLDSKSSQIAQPRPAHVPRAAPCSMVRDDQRVGCTTADLVSLLLQSGGFLAGAATHALLKVIPAVGGASSVRKRGVSWHSHAPVVDPLFQYRLFKKV